MDITVRVDFGQIYSTINEFFFRVFPAEYLVFSGVFRRFPVIRCFPVFLVTAVQVLYLLEICCLG